MLDTDICPYVMEMSNRSGQTIGANDLLVAAHARSLGLTLVTNNVPEFERVPGLQVENWALPAG